MVYSEDIDTWILEFCSKIGNEYFVIVDTDFAMDKFNLVGLNQHIPHFKESLKLLADMESDPDEAVELEKKLPTSSLKEETRLLYGLIHARFIQTHNGLTRMNQKYYECTFGFCPRFYCDSERMLPVGLSDTPGEDTVKTYCPKCKDIYIPPLIRHRNIDGAFFGTGFPQLFFMNFPEYHPPSAPYQFVPRLYGFKIHPQAYEIQRETRDPAAAFRRCINNVLGHSLSKLLSNQKSKKTSNKQAAIAPPRVIVTASSSSSLSSNKTEDELV